MPNYCEYTTLVDLRAPSATTELQIDLAGTKADTLLLSIARSVSRQMENGGRWYYPQIITRHYDRVGGRQLDFPETDFLEVTTVTNGDGSVISSANYDLLPYDFLPYYGVRLKLTSGIVWLVDTSGNSERAITVAGVGGFVKDYGTSWVTQSSVTGVLTASTTALTGLTSGEIHAGQLLKLGSGNDYAYVTAAATEPGTTSATIIRGVNGCTAATHGASDPIAVWHAGADLEDLCRRAVQALYKLRSNPVGDTLTVPGMGTFVTPKDVNKWIGDQLVGMGYAQPY